MGFGNGRGLQADRAWTSRDRYPEAVLRPFPAQPDPGWLQITARTHREVRRKAREDRRTACRTGILVDSCQTESSPRSCSPRLCATDRVPTGSGRRFGPASPRPPRRPPVFRPAERGEQSRRRRGGHVWGHRRARVRVVPLERTHRTTAAYRISAFQSGAATSSAHGSKDL